MTPTEIIELNIVCTLIGFLLGNRLAIGRDKRNEWNALVAPIHIALLRIKNGSLIGLPNDWEMTISLMRERLPRLRRRGFDRAVEEYEKSRSGENQNEYKPEIGGFSEGGPYKDLGLIARAAVRLLKYLKPR